MFLPRSKVEAWSRYRSDAVAKAAKISMLAEPALALLAKLAEVAGGPIIELGPYIGGSTIALASGARERVVTVEIGGSNPRDDALASDDILADLRRNLARERLTSRVTIVEGHFRDAEVVQRVEKALGGRPAKILFVDLLPGTEVALGLYGRYLDNGAFVVVDDYRSDIARDKAEWVSRFLDRAVSQGALEEIGVFGWGTWFGRLAPTGGREKLMSLRGPIPCVRESGHAWQVFVGHNDLADDRTGNASPLELLENERPLGPAHCLHAEIREKGGGRYSHWAGNLWFSASDNSDPRANGRRYAIRVGGPEIELSAPEALPAAMASSRRGPRFWNTRARRLTRG
jgi:predicted O-methyltransferase YrrM